MLSRPYDVAFDPVLRTAVRLRREHPTGVLHRIKTLNRGNKDVCKFPWGELELGDFFFAPLNPKNTKSLPVSLCQAAARYDYEISTRTMKDPQGYPCLRVTLTFIGIRAIRMKARNYHHCNIQISDGRWKERLKKWRRRRAA